MRIPFGTTGLELSRDVAGAEVLESAIGTLKAEGSEDDIVKKAMANPIGSPKLSELAKGKKTATIIVSDHTRPVPSKHILPFMLAELREGNPDIDITLLIATGFHRPTSHEELVNKVGEKIANEEKFVCHDSRDPESNVEIGVLPSGAKLVIDKVAAETDLLVSEGFIEPHFFAGFSGGRKSVLPGVCDQVTVLGNHCSKFIDSPCARTGILEGNPLHNDMVAAAKLAKLQYIVNVVIDEEKHVAAAFAGDPFQAHETGCAFLKGYCRVKPEKKGDIVITSNGGAPLEGGRRSRRRAHHLHPLQRRHRRRQLLSRPGRLRHPGAPDGAHPGHPHGQDRPRPVGVPDPLPHDAQAPHHLRLRAFDAEDHRGDEAGVCPRSGHRPGPGPGGQGQGCPSGHHPQRHLRHRGALNPHRAILI